MPEPTTGPRRVRAVRAALAAAVATGLLAACSGGHSAPGPKTDAGNATVIARLARDTPVARAVTSPPPRTGAYAMASGSDGSLLLSVPGYVARLGPKGTLAPVASGTGTAAPTGVTGLPDGSFVTATGGRLLRYIPGRRPTVLAGTGGTPRSLTAPVPASVASTAVRFTPYVTPVGSAGDGSLVIADGNTLWRLMTGHVTRIATTQLLGRGYAVTPGGTVYLIQEGAGALLEHTYLVGPAGSLKPITLPSSVPGVSGAPGTLSPLAVTSDGKDGVYLHAVRTGGDGKPTGDYVLHLSDGTAALTAASSAPGTATTCSATGDTSPLAFPCPLPQAIVSQPGLLVLAGGTTYAVGVRMPLPAASASGTPKP